MEVDPTPAAAGPTPMEVDEEAATEAFTAKLKAIKDLEAKQPEEAIAKYKALIAVDSSEDPTVKGREQAIFALCNLFVKLNRPDAIMDLSKELRPLLNELAKAKTAKIVRTFMDYLAKIPGSTQLQITMCKDCIAWCNAEKRTFLRQRVEKSLAALLLEEKKYNDALDLLSKLLAEVKKLDDKLLLVEIHLIECQTHYAVQNIPKSKAALTAAKTSANAIHCPPLLQADIDFWSGVVTAREKDYRTAFSYFYEAFEAFNVSEVEQKARTSMKFMLLSKIMNNLPKAVHSIISSKSGLKYTGIEIDAMSAIASAHEERSLKKFEKLLSDYKAQLVDDPIIQFHLSDLNETLLEQNIIRILEPYSRVEITHVAELIDLPLQRTQTKLRQMILDQKLNGTLDQGVGVLIVFEKEEVRSTYDNALKTIRNTSEVLDTLYGIAKQTT